MAFDTTTRNRLAKFVAEARRVLTEEFSEQLQSLYGISAAGGIAPLEKLTHLDAEGLELAATLRQRIAYLTSSSPAAGEATKPAIDRLTREQAFTVLNRLAAIRMAEKRGLIVESVGQQYQSRGFKVFESVAGSAIGDTYDRYRCYLFCLFDELAIDLGSLFDRRSPQALLFPREQPLLALLTLLDDADLQDLWAEDETIGWIYQYYNDPAERKKMREESAAPRNSRELAVRNQFFTPRYVVEFLTDNTLGRIWYEMTQGVTSLKEQCRYLVRRPTEIFLKPGETAPEQPTQDGLSQEDLLKQPVFIAHRPLKDPRRILMLDPACGSMHFGLYAFDLFEAIYDEAWEIAAGSDATAKTGEAFAPFCTFAASFADKAAFQRDVPRMIVEHNLHGIDIDPRAAQIAGLSLWLRAQRAWHAASVKPVDRPRITRSNIVCAEPMPGDKMLLAEFVEQQFPEGERAAFGFLLETVFDRMTLAGEAGSLLKIEEEIRTAIAEAKKIWEKEPAFNQRMLFGGENAAAVTQKKLDLSGITDEQFWEGAEERIYDALRDYAEQAETGGFQRRLFAEDAARGFAFIDICKKHYDVVVMNPPFGEGLEGTDALLQRNYNEVGRDLAATFIERGESLLGDAGTCGCIATRGLLIGHRLTGFRESYFFRGNQLRFVADLGSGVLDAAVEVACTVLEPASRPAGCPCFDLTTEREKGDRLLSITNAWRNGQVANQASMLDLSVLAALPDRIVTGWIPPWLSRLFSAVSPLDPSQASVVKGLITGDDFRFIRLYAEVAAHQIGQSLRWNFFAKGGEYSPYHHDIQTLLGWEMEGRELKEFARMTYDSESRTIKNQDRYGLAGISYSMSSSIGFSARVHPSGTVLADIGPVVLPRPEVDPLTVLAYLNSTICIALLKIWQGGRRGRYHWISDSLQGVPAPRMNLLAASIPLVQSIIALLRDSSRYDETGTHFIGTTFAAECLLREHFESARCRVETSAVALARLAEKIDQHVADVLCVNKADVESIKLLLFTDAESASSVYQQRFPESVATYLEECLLYLVGISVGRWDIRYATGQKAAPELPDPFAPLPVCPPGQLQNAHGLPAGPEDVPATYPLKDIPWDGILVDDANHPLDIERRVREVIEIIWTGKEGGPTAEAIEVEACEILGVKTLRDYFRKPANFFADHLKRYSKSRRQAPIYWPLSTKSGSYTLWIYYHRLNDQTLHKCLADFLDPKIKDVESELGKLTGKDSGRAADLRDFLNELKDLKDEIERVIKLPWKPNLNDGVLITASPLWKLFRLSKWQKDLKACWEELEKGDYDWAHLAYTIWPERVENVCEKDRSIAIAHGLEHLCKIEPPKPKKPRGKKASS